MATVLTLTPAAQTILDNWRTVNEALRLFIGHQGFNHSGKFGELLIREQFGLTWHLGKINAIDAIDKDGKTYQIKCTNEESTHVTCSYFGTEGVDYMIVIEVNKETTEVTALYFGPFLEFVTEINKHTRVMKKDGHRRASKKLIATLNDFYGTPLPT